MELVKSKAEFLDGPMKGQVKEFDRVEPPAFLPCGSLTYVRDINLFEQGEKWIYMLDFPKYPDF